MSPLNQNESLHTKTTQAKISKKYVFMETKHQVKLIYYEI